MSAAVRSVPSSASTLSEEGHDVSVIDRNEKNLELLSDDYSGMTTVGVPIDQDVLKKAGIESCDAVAAVSQDDNVNIHVFPAGTGIVSCTFCFGADL